MTVLRGTATTHASPADPALAANRRRRETSLIHIDTANDCGNVPYFRGLAASNEEPHDE
jgi:hypothetical protein